MDRRGCYERFPLCWDQVSLRLKHLRIDAASRPTSGAWPSPTRRVYSRTVDGAAFMTSSGCCSEIFASKVFVDARCTSVDLKHIGWLRFGPPLFRQMAFHRIQMSLSRAQPPPPLSEGPAECIQIAAFLIWARERHSARHSALAAGPS